MFSDTFDLPHLIDLERLECGGDAVNRVGGRRQQLPRRAGVADLVGPLAKEAHSPRANVQPRPHPIPVVTRGGNRNGTGQHDPADARERIGDDLRLDLELPGIRDMRVEAAPAQQIGEGFTAIGRRVLDGHRLCIDDALANPLDPHRQPLTGNRGRDEHDLPADPRDHAAAGRGLVDENRNQLPGNNAHGEGIEESSGERERRQPESFTRELVDRGFAGAAIRLNGHHVTKAGQFRIGLQFEGLPLGVAERGSSHRQAARRRARSAARGAHDAPRREGRVKRRARHRAHVMRDRPGRQRRRRARRLPARLSDG